jgi:hypothetical protein
VASPSPTSKPRVPHPSRFCERGPRPACWLGREGWDVNRPHRPLHPSPTSKPRVPHPSRFCEGWDVKRPHRPLRPSHRHSHRRRPNHRAASRPHHLHPAIPPSYSHPSSKQSPPTPRLPQSRLPSLRRRPTAQPGQICHSPIIQDTFHFCFFCTGSTYWAILLSTRGIPSAR